MKIEYIRHGYAHVVVAAFMALAGCTVMEHDGAHELGSVGRHESALLTPASLALGLSYSCARTGIEVNCWGHNGVGQLGYGNTTFFGDNEPASTPGDISVGGDVVELAAGATHNCVLLDTGAVRCWGQGFWGQLGYGNTDKVGDDEFPSDVGTVSLSSDAVHIATGYNHSCALLDTGLIQCWGDNGGGQLGYGHIVRIGDDELPSSQSPVSAGGTVVQLVAGSGHTCALLDTGDVRCWGRGSYGVLGYGYYPGHIGDNEAITSVGTVPVGGTVVQLAAGNIHTCALLDTGAVRCWGFNSSGELGYGHTATIGDNETPSAAGDVDLGGTAVQITAGYNHTCALLDTGDVRCWGNDAGHQLGYVGSASDIGDDELPSSAGDVDVGDPVVEVAAGSHHTCARVQDGAIRCWGSGDHGRLGYGNTADVGDNETPAFAGDVP